MYVLLRYYSTHHSTITIMDMIHGVVNGYGRCARWFSQNVKEWLQHFRLTCVLVRKDQEASALFRRRCHSSGLSEEAVLWPHRFVNLEYLPCSYDAMLIACLEILRHPGS